MKRMTVREDALTVALYARVSTDDKGQNPEVQLDVLRRIAESRGFTIFREYVDYASGKDANRPQFQLMMSDASKHRFDAIFAVRIDRIMRSLSNLSSIVQDLQRYHVKLMFTDFELDPSNPSSTLVFNVLSSIAEWEREIISKRTKEGLSHAANNGKIIGRRKRELPIRKIALMVIEGYNLTKISKTIGIPRTTLYDHKHDIDSEIELLKKSM